MGKLNGNEKFALSLLAIIGVVVCGVLGVIGTVIYIGVHFLHKVW